MVIGNGMLAKAFECKYVTSQDVIIFASGVSNSLCNDPAEFEREFRLVKSTLLSNPTKLFVYFSSTSIYDEDLQSSAYVLHKKNIENYLKNHSSSRVLVFRLPIIAGNTPNKTTLLNFLFEKIKTGEKFLVYENTYRSIIDIDDIVRICSAIINSEILDINFFNIFNPYFVSIPSIVSLFEKVIEKKAIFCSITRGRGFPPVIKYEIRPIIEHLNIDFGHNYLENTLNKYYRYK